MWDRIAGLQVIFSIRVLFWKKAGRSGRNWVWKASGAWLRPWSAWAMSHFLMKKILRRPNLFLNRVLNFIESTENGYSNIRLGQHGFCSRSLCRGGGTIYEEPRQISRAR